MPTVPSGSTRSLHPVRRTSLVAEDVKRLADDIAEGLRDQGMAVDVAYDGMDTAFKLDLNDYDVLVLDRDLPGCTATPSAG
jgi:DNA-binding response OmpR family regulator